YTSSGRKWPSARPSGSQTSHITTTGAPRHQPAVRNPGRRATHPREGPRSPDLATEDGTMDRRSPGTDASPCRELPEPREWVERYGDVLYRYALARLRRPQDAEEAVQETLLAALQARGEFRGRAHPRSWLVGILRHKVLSRLRAAARRGPSADVGDLDAF